MMICINLRLSSLIKGLERKNYTYTPFMTPTPHHHAVKYWLPTIPHLPHLAYSPILKKGKPTSYTTEKKK